jgi:hypothetical protein
MSFGNENLPTAIPRGSKVEILLLFTAQKFQKLPTPGCLPPNGGRSPARLPKSPTKNCQIFVKFLVFHPLKTILTGNLPPSLPISRQKDTISAKSPVKLFSSVASGQLATLAASFISS